MFQQAWQLIRTTLQIWTEAKSSRMSAAMTYYTMLSLAPMLMIAIAIAAQFYSSDKVKEQILDYARDVASSQVATTLSELIDKSSTRQSGLIASLISICVLLYGASGIFTQLFETFNDIWKVPIQKRSGLRFSIRNRLVGVVMVLSVGGLLIATLALSSVIASISQLLDGNYPRLISWLSLADRGLSFILMPFVLSLMFWYFPAKKFKWMDVWPAAGLTAILLACSRYLIDIYLRLSTASEVYGAAGSLVLFLVWIYMTGMIVFFGAAFSCAWTKIYGSHAKITDSDETIDHSLLKGIRLDALAGIGTLGSSLLKWKSEETRPVDKQPVNSNSLASSSADSVKPSTSQPLSPPLSQPLSQPSTELDNAFAKLAEQSNERDLSGDLPNTSLSDNSGTEPDRVAIALRFNRPVKTKTPPSRANNRLASPSETNQTNQTNQTKGNPSGAITRESDSLRIGNAEPLQPTRRHWSVAVAREIRDLKQDDLQNLQAAMNSVESRIANEYTARLASRKKAT